MLCSLVVGLILVAQQITHAQYTPLFKPDQKITAFSGKYTLEYGGVQDHDDLFALRVVSDHATGFTGVGWNSPTKRMLDGNAFVVSPCSGCNTETPALRRLVTQDPGANGNNPNPPLVGWENEIVNYTVQIDSGVVTISLIKNTSVGDHQQKPDEPRTLIYVQSETLEMNYHGANRDYVQGIVLSEPAPPPPKHHRSLLDGAIELSWTAFQDTGMIDFELVSANPSVYAGFGWNQDGEGMIGSTAYLFSDCAGCDTANPGTLFHLGDKDETKVLPKVSQAEINVTAFESRDGKLYVNFTKDTAKGFQFDMAEDVTIVYSVGPSAAKAQHTERDLQSFNFVKPPNPSAVGASSITAFGGDLKVEWVVNVPENKINFTLTSLKPENYFGFGWNKDGAKMIGASAFLFSNCASCDTAGGKVFDLKAKLSNEVVSKTDQSEIEILSFESKDGELVVRFVKDANKGEKFNVGRSVGVVLSQGGTPEKSRHVNREAKTINFATGNVSDAGEDAVRWAHGILMLLSWGVLLPMGMFIARFYKHRDPWWFRMHRGLQMSGLLLATIGFILALTMVEGAHFQDPNALHKIIGLIVMLFGWIQPINAFVRPHPGTPKRPQWNLIHWGFGRSAIVLGFLNIIFGLGAIEAPVWLTVLYYLWLVGFVVAFIVKNVQRNNGQQDKLPTKGSAPADVEVEQQTSGSDDTSK